jgi:lambda family phage portal protein
MGLFNLFFGKKINKIRTEAAREAAIIATNGIIKQASKTMAYYRSMISTGGSKYPYGLSSSGTGVFLDHSKILQNARKSVFESVQAKSLVDRFAESIVDIGLKLEAMPDFEILGITPEAAEEWGRNVSQRYHLVQKSKAQHRAGLYNQYQAQLLYAKAQQRDNDIFVRFYYSNRRDLISPLQFDFVDPCMIRGYAYTSTGNNFMIDDGIVRNADGSERSYKIWEIDSQGQYQERDIPRIGAKSGKLMMIHGFQPEYAGQGRGYSRLAHALQEFQNITDFSLAVIKKAINQSGFVGGIENQQQDPSDAGFESLMRSRGAGPPEKQATESQVTATVVDDGTAFSVQELPELTQRVPGSSFLLGMAQGDALKMYENRVPSESYEQFINAFVSHLSASTGMPIEVMLMKFNQSYSASRATLVIFWRICQIWREEMIADWLNPHYEAWLGEEIAAGRIIAPGWYDPILRAAWLNNSWIGAPMPNIDPQREAKAQKEYLDIGATTQNRVARGLNGTSAKDNIAVNRRMFPETPVPPWNGPAPAQENNQNMEDENNGSTSNS